jgi:hypothetical protein
LHYLRKLWLLRKMMFHLDKPCLDKLKEIAMRAKFDSYSHPVDRSRPVTSLDEACYAGSEAAWFLKEYELTMAQHRRLKSIQKAEQTKKEADDKIRKLSK